MPMTPSLPATLVADLRRELSTDSSTAFITYCAERIGFPVDQTKEVLDQQVIPYVAHASSEFEPFVPSAAVGTLLDLASEFGPELLKSWIERCDQPVCMDASDYLTRYAETRQCLLDKGVELTSEIWPVASSIELADTKGYKGCRNNNDNYNPPAQRDYSSSGGSSSSGSSEGSPLGVVILGAGALIYYYPYIVVPIAILIVLNIVLAAFIWRWLNFAIYAVSCGFGAHLGVEHFMATWEWGYGVAAIGITAFLGGSIGLLIADLRQTEPAARDVQSGTHQDYGYDIDYGNDVDESYDPDKRY
jgi:hypothetical protein